MKRSQITRKQRMSPRSKKAKRQSLQRGAIRLQVFERDEFACRARFFTDELGRCFGPLTPHHVVKASAGGEYSPENLVSLCTAHQSAVEDYPLVATALGLVQRAPVKFVPYQRSVPGPVQQAPSPPLRSRKPTSSPLTSARPWDNSESAA